MKNCFGFRKYLNLQRDHILERLINLRATLEDLHAAARAPGYEPISTLGLPRAQ